MIILNRPMSKEQKRLRLHAAMKLLMEGEDFDYIRMCLGQTFPASFNQRDLKDIALKIAMLSHANRQALIKDIALTALRLATFKPLCPKTHKRRSA